ncbi:hypothetical protein TB2_012969 [Malus domestica]
MARSSTFMEKEKEDGPLLSPSSLFHLNRPFSHVVVLYYHLRPSSPTPLVLHLVLHFHEPIHLPTTHYRLLPRLEVLKAALAPGVVGSKGTWCVCRSDL